MRTRQDEGERTRKCLTRLQRLIPKPEAKFTSNHKEKIGPEYLSISMEFKITGAWMDEANGKIMIQVVVDSWDPSDFDLDPKLINDLVETTFLEELRWLKDVPWAVSLDHRSIVKLMRGEQKMRYWKEIARPIKKGEMSEDEVVEVLASFIAELRPELKDILISNKAMKVKEGMVTYESNGLPCPICLGHLSEEAIFSLYHRLRFSMMFDGEEE